MGMKALLNAALRSSAPGWAPAINFSVVVLVWAIAWQQGAEASAPASGWGNMYGAPAGVPAWNGGSLAPMPAGTGYVLSAFGPAPNSPGSASLALARLDALGNVKWGAFAIEGAMGGTTLKAAGPENALYAKIEGLAQEQFWTVFGVFNPLDGTRVFERGVRLSVTNTSSGYLPDPAASADYLSDGRSFVLLDYDSQAKVELAVLDQTGQVEWQKSFVAPSFARWAVQSAKSSLIEYVGSGFLLVVLGSERISTAPNPPVYNTSLTVNLIRLSAQGEVVWAEKVEGLIASDALPPLQAWAIGGDGSLVLSLSDTITTSPTNPLPSGFASLALTLGPDGQLRWAGQIRGVAGTGLTPFWVPDQSSIFFGGDRLRSLTAPSVDGLLLKANAQTGDLMAQISIDLSQLDSFTVAGVTSDRVFVNELERYLDGRPTTALAGSFDLNLQNGHWKQFSANNGVQSAMLLLNTADSGLTFAAFPNGDHRIETMQLDTDLNPSTSAQGTCQFFTDLSVATQNPQLTLEKLALTQSALALTVTISTIELAPTARIQLQSLTPTMAPLCPQESLLLGLPRMVAGTITVSLSGASAGAVQVEASSDLRSWTLLTQVTNAATAGAFSDALTNATRRFYRALAPR